MAFGNYGYNPYLNPYQYQPMQQMMQQPAQPVQQSQQIGGITWVQGEAGAKAYIVRPGEGAFLMDSERPMAYYKQVDGTGMPLPMKYYSVKELTGEQIPGNEPQAKPEYLTAADIEGLKKDVKELKKAMKILRGVDDDE